MHPMAGILDRDGSGVLEELGLAELSGVLEEEHNGLKKPPALVALPDKP